MDRRLLLTLLFFTACGSRPPPPGAYDGRDITGNYTLTYDNQLTAKLSVGGAIREVTQTGYGGIVDFGTINGNPTTLDLTAFCAKPDVDCPSEAFWQKVAIDQPDLQKNGLKLQKVVVINDTIHLLDAGVRAAAFGGLVDNANEDRYLLGLGAKGGANGNCAALALSLSGGRFTRVGEHLETTMEYRTSKGKPCDPDAGVPDAGADDGGTSDGGADAGVPETCELTPITRRVVPPEAKVSGIAEGKVVMGFAGGCAFGPVLVGATLTLETGYTGTRTGDFDPPPFEPAEVVLPDGGLDEGDGGVADGGTDGGP